MRSMSKQRNKIIFVIVISMVLSACAVHEVPKENERYIEETGDEDSENAREEPKTEAVPEEQETDESITEEAKGQIPEDAKEYLELIICTRTGRRWWILSCMKQRTSCIMSGNP